MKDLSEYIESILDGLINNVIEVTLENGVYFIDVIRESSEYNKNVRNIINLVTNETITNIMKTYFPNDEVKFKISNIFV
jgi:hypothetical protein